ncbi:MAG: AAA family ATPase [Verrucomicrobiales bacterium]|nr:AAA family ATPase [Verrucomicrobiales bacterium]
MIKEETSQLAIVQSGIASLAQGLPSLDHNPSTAREVEELTRMMGQSAMNPTSLAQLEIPKREPIIGEWFREGDLGFVFAPRGLGKTWLSMLMARKCADGHGSCGLWTVHRTKKVLYVDGEMPLDSMLERDRLIASLPSENLTFLQHEAFFHQHGRVLNLSDPTTQQALLAHCQANGVEILILDNLSCLFSGVKENDADAWELVLPWLLTLRRNRIAVVIVAHAGRNGQMRGTSRREDAAFWVIQLSEVADAASPKTGARFVSKFIKNRNGTEEACPSYQWEFTTKPTLDEVEVRCAIVSPLDQLVGWVRDGLSSASDIAVEMGVSKGQVSKLAKQAIERGLIRKEAREYLPCP